MSLSSACRRTMALLAVCFLSSAARAASHDNLRYYSVNGIGLGASVQDTGRRKRGPALERASADDRQRRAGCRALRQHLAPVGIGDGSTQRRCRAERRAAAGFLRRPHSERPQSLDRAPPSRRSLSSRICSGRPSYRLSSEPFTESVRTCPRMPDSACRSSTNRISLAMSPKFGLA